jgi:hypothetical protein
VEVEGKDCIVGLVNYTNHLGKVEYFGTTVVITTGMPEICIVAWN